ncbi:tyrosine-type recombinase/integrase [Brumimicrobium oceani]|uniref:Integrase n=1 Tax=Brumimicrobium oceani TaxID=2100725 RepID=A0A2U2X0B4_9FLAO|nr:tyrosine-type recombinase/integrase [Brumimicrobium oceani]PWH81217.1 integrase [Brumimicrobium oceani]
MHEKLTKSFSINGKSKSTLNNYSRCLAHLALHYNKSPEHLDKEAIDDYLFHCKNQHNTPSDSFFKHTIYGLRAIYKLLGMDGHKVQLPEIKRQNDLPVVMSLEEVKRLINAPKYLKHRLMIATLYGCGLRSYELCALKLSDVDFDRNTVFVKKQKGKQDRFVPLSKHLARGLQKYIRTEKPVIYLFNSQVTDNGKPLPITVRAIQWVIKENRSKIGTSKKITAHILRHSYATHLLESGLNLLALKDLLGHARIETTLIYLHVSNSGSSKKYSPLDLIYNT